MMRVQQKTSSTQRDIRRIILALVVILLIPTACARPGGQSSSPSSAFSSRKCPPVPKSDEQVLRDDVVKVGFLIPSNWILQVDEPGGLKVTQSFYSAAEARVNGTKCDFYVLPIGATMQAELAQYDSTTVISEEDVTLCGMTKAKYIRHNIPPGALGASEARTVIAQTKQERIVVLMCMGVNTTPMIPILGSLHEF